MTGKNVDEIQALYGLPDTITSNPDKTYLYEWKYTKKSIYDQYGERKDPEKKSLLEKVGSSMVDSMLGIKQPGDIVEDECTMSVSVANDVVTYSQLNKPDSDECGYFLKRWFSHQDPQKKKFMNSYLSPNNPWSGRSIISLEQIFGKPLLQMALPNNLTGYTWLGQYYETVDAPGAYDRNGPKKEYKPTTGDILVGNFRPSGIIRYCRLDVIAKDGVAIKSGAVREDNSMACNEFYKKIRKLP